LSVKKQAQKTINHLKQSTDQCGSEEQGYV